MNIVVCIDDIGGMTLNNRRLSRDRVLIENLIETIGEHRLFMSEYSACLFKECADAHIIADEKYLAIAQPEDFCFVEREALLEYADKVDKIVVYKWNRRYPATTFFDLSLENWHVCDSTQFVGSSHEKITKEIYIK